MASFTHQHQHPSSSARSGVLSFPGGAPSCPTPLCLLACRRNGLPHLTAEKLADIDPHAPVVCNFYDLVEYATTLEKNQQQQQQQQQPLPSLHQFLGLSGHPIVVNIKDPYYPFSTAPVSDKGIAIDAPNGRTFVTPERYLSAIRHLAPDAFVLLSDEGTGGSPHVSKKRSQRTVQRTQRWVGTQAQAMARTTSLTPLRDRVIVPVQGHVNMIARRDSVTAATALSSSNGPSSSITTNTTDNNNTTNTNTNTNTNNTDNNNDSTSVSGFVIGGLHQGETPSERRYIIDTCISSLPPDPFRMVSGMDSPFDVLAAVSQGIDVFDAGYPFIMAQQGFASTFTFTSTLGDPGNRTTPMRTRINLRDCRYAHDTSPLMTGCTCMTCCRHSRAYIFHLHDAQELLAVVLLTIHNVHHYLQFFQDIRHSIESGTFDQDYQQFLQCYGHK